MRFSVSLVTKILLAVVSYLVLVTATRADCNIPFVPPARSPIFCTVSTPQQAEECRRQADQAYARQMASSRQEWQRQQLECQAREQQRDIQRRAAEQAAAERVEQARRAAEQQRYIAEQKAKEAVAQVERQRAQAEKARQEAETAAAQAAAAEAKHRLELAAHAGTGWDSPITGGQVTVFGILAFLAFTTFKEWIHASVPKKLKIFAFLIPAIAELGIYLVFGVEIHEPTVADFVKLNLPVGVAAGTGFLVHHSIRFAYG
jgi:Fe2+ transport system protein B